MKDQESPSGEDSTRVEPTRVVALGASAGGLSSLEEFLSAVTAADDVAFVVAQHLAPGHSSLLVDLLSRVSDLGVEEARDGEPLRSGVILVAPPNRDISVVGNAISLVTPPERFGPSPSIDVLFGSLADEWGPRSVGIVLSGTGSDGALGMRRLRAAGGLCLVQSPETASFDGMPRAAIALGGVDLIGSAAQLGTRVSGLSGMPESELGSHLSVATVDLIDTVVGTLKRKVGVDFGRYKLSTLQRQIQRRMAIRDYQDVAEYVSNLVDDPTECRALMANLLVTVTSFFRDPEAFGSLAEQIQSYVDDQSGEPLRVWVPGCATGEEAFSIAMLVGEALGYPLDLDRRLKVFGTDLDDTSLEFARRAVYPAAALEQIPAHLRERYVKLTPDGFRIAEVLRECTVFARQDVTTDPPFPQMDLVSCRNTLIYFTESLQSEVMGMFAFAVKPGGLLFLGKAEGMQASAGNFEPIDLDSRIFRRTEAVSIGSFRTTRSPAVRRPLAPLRHSTLVASSESALGNQVDLLETLLRSSGSSYLVLDSRQELVHVIGDVSRFCIVPQGRMTSTGGSFLRPELQSEARALLLLSKAGRDSVEGQYLHLDDDLVVQMTSTPLEVGDEQFMVLILTTIEADAEPPTRGPERSESFDRELQRLERELEASQEVLQRSMAELQAANQELEATTEELQASMEELQAANEELQAANEELQATNEELGTMNEEQREHAQELGRINLDLENIQASTTQGMVFVDRELKVTRYTPKAVRMFAITPDDIGQSFLQVPTAAPMPDLGASLRQVANGGGSLSFEAESPSGHYLVQILPYHGPTGAVIGAIVTLTDVTEQAELRMTAETAVSALQEKSRMLTRQATVDELTGLGNRTFFAESLQREIDRCSRTSERLALVWVDLDHFKEVNDGLGHESGDVTLRTCAERVSRVVRVTDVVGRLGGDEFGVILLGPENFTELDAVLDRVVTSFRGDIATPGGEARVTASLGVAIYPEDAGSAQALLRSADAAMYSVKARSGDGYAYFDESMNRDADRRRDLRRRIAKGIDDDGFTLHYQPIIRTDGGEIWGVEALLRWQDEGILRAADDFIPFAEESGQIRALGDVTLRNLHVDRAAFREAGLADMHISVNMSVTQLEDDDLLELISRWPNPEGLHGLVIEVVESIFLPDHRKAMDSLAGLVEMGALTSVDDFGSGYSNYRLLRSLSPQFIKLDRSFLSEESEIGERRALISSAVQVAHAVGAQVVAEGIETQDHWDLMREAGVDFVQGYLIAMPMSLVEVLAWLDERKAGRA